MASLPKGRELLTWHAYERAAQRYLHSLPPEHFMESLPQGTQRKITLASLALVQAVRPEVQVFNELLVQYPTDDPNQRIGQVVPDNMIVLHPEPIDVDGSYNLPFQPVGPFLVIEYVSKSSQRKDYDENIRRYQELVKVPYYLIFYPENQDITLFEKKPSGRYGSVYANEFNRFPIPELELEVGLHDGWMRYWFRGELLPLPGDLLHKLNETQQRLAETEQEKLEEIEKRQAAEQAKIEEMERRKEAERAKLEEMLRRQEAEKAKAMAEQARLEAEKAKTEADQILRSERQARSALEAELQRLRAEMELLRKNP